MTRFRLYYDKDVEQAWINEMSKQGWALEHFFLGFYTFSPSAPGEYLYQIDLLDSWSGNSNDFATFMEDIGVEVVSQWYRWVFLRKKASEGAFEMYTDTESKIAQYNKVKRFFLVGFILELLCFCMEFYALLSTGSLMFLFFTLFIGLLLLVFLRMVWKCSWKIQQLKQYS